MNIYIQKLIKEQFSISDIDFSSDDEYSANIFNKEINEDPQAEKYYKKMVEQNILTVKMCNYLRDKSNIVKVKSRFDLKKIVKLYSQKAFCNKSMNWLDVSDITDMSFLFMESKYNGDINKWDVSNVTDMYEMFAYSSFNNNIYNWNVSNVTNMQQMFCCSKFNKNISTWDISNVSNMTEMFSWSIFNMDISNWRIKDSVPHDGMFAQCPIKEQYKPIFY